MHGAVERVRPKMMTVVAIMAGLLPILWSTSTGSEVMRRIAVPMVDSMVSSTFLTLLVIPAVYAIIKGWGLPIEQKHVHQLTGRSEFWLSVRILRCYPECRPSTVEWDSFGKRARTSWYSLSLWKITTKKLLHADATARLRPDTRQ